MPRGKKNSAAEGAVQEPSTKEVKMISVTEIANKLNISAKTARAKLRRKVGKQRWLWPAQEAKQVERFLSGKADSPIAE